MERHVLVIFPHPDDEAFGVSGSIALYRKQGIPVTYMCGTLGEMGRNLGQPPTATRESLPQIRKNELQEACKAVGIEDLRMLGLHDKTIEFEDEEKIIKMVSDAIDELNPSLIITFYPNYCVHPDHEAMASAVVEAVKRLPAHNRPVIHGVAFAHNSEQELGNPDIVRDVSEVIEQKKKAIYAHQSQVSGLSSAVKSREKVNDEQLFEWLKTERFWTYPLSHE
ncbi:bacillithiol biosynthesis deacetylase BshB2 [Bacillus solimangrovi]|uniref:Bacillithiol biosynthesis deacetylase BshB2 n=1 Tax=Bacillus solimangrovi TaxID=1305675 RepID=A0A1E5LF58_9BACI|nr:bacillithiol biosynthesis deacetylase BshB2 [Bacillus solimangrovi]OEH92702.1 bacillithiol biosynthesis deacetylase BshB2 [Bacillus solimangrovi]